MEFVAELVVLEVLLPLPVGADHLIAVLLQPHAKVRLRKRTHSTVREHILW